MEMVMMSLLHDITNPAQTPAPAPAPPTPCRLSVQLARWIFQAFSSYIILAVMFSFSCKFLICLFTEAKRLDLVVGD